MQRQAELQRRLAGGLPLAIEAGHAGMGRAGRLQRLLAGSLGRARVGDRKDRQQAVADELQNLAAEGFDGCCQTLEMGVQQIDDPVPRQPPRERGEAAQVGVPQDRFDAVAIAPPDGAGQDPLASAPAEIGRHQGRGHLLERQDLQGCRRRPDDLGQECQLVRGEAARPLGRKGERMLRAVAEGQAPGGMGGQAFGRQRDEAVAAAGQDLAGRMAACCAVQRAVEQRQLERWGGAGPPLIDRGRHQGMQRRQLERGLGQLEPARDQPLAQPGQQAGGIARPAGREVQPGDEVGFGVGWWMRGSLHGPISIAGPQPPARGLKLRRNWP